MDAIYQDLADRFPTYPDLNIRVFNSRRELVSFCPQFHKRKVLLLSHDIPDHILKQIVLGNVYIYGGRCFTHDMQKELLNVEWTDEYDNEVICLFGEILDSTKPIVNKPQIEEWSKMWTKDFWFGLTSIKTSGTKIYSIKTYKVKPSNPSKMVNVCLQKMRELIEQ